MLTLDLTRLERRDGPVHIQERLAAGAEIFEGVDLPLAGSLSVDLVVSPLDSGEIMVRGSYAGVLARECRRCLDPVEVSLHEEVALLFAPRDERDEHAVDPEERDGDVRTFDLASGEIDLGEAIREEVILSAPLYVECDPECRGLCPRCGTNLNESSCDCTRSEPDPRWAALRELNVE